MTRKRAALVPSLALALLSALPLAAAPAEPAPAALPAMAAPATCPAAPAFLAESASPAPAVATPARLAPAGLARKFHGFCPCGCSFVPDCNTSADCFGGATCQTAPSCC